MQTVPAATLALSGAAPAPLPLAPARGERPDLRARSAALAASVLARAAAGGAALVLLAGAYTAKRRLGVDVFPGVDVLPDPEIETAIGAAAGLLLRWF